MDCAVAVIASFAPAQINYTKIVRKCVGIFLKLQPESQNVVKALLDPASNTECFLVFPEDGILALLKSNATTRGWLTVCVSDFAAQGGEGQPAAPPTVALA